MINRYKYMLCIASMGVALTMAASAQTITGNIGGTVTDSTGSVIPGAKVTAVNVDTNVAVSATSNAAGSYSIRFLQIGKYKVVIEAKGFAKSIYGPYTLEIDQIAKVDAKLSIGQATETVEVTGAVAPILNTDNSQIDTVFDANTIANIPINGQNFSALMQYMPGAVSTQPSGFAGVGSIERNTGSSGQVSVNGNRLQTNNYLWDGVEINETINNLIGYNPSVDSIQEMKVVSADPNAEYGNANGGDVIMVMKNGTNKFHGSVYGHLENQDLNANTFSNKHVTPGDTVSARPIYTQDQFGATFGGPLLRNKLFFFAAFEAGRIHRSNAEPLYLATAAMRKGDFSEVLPGDGRNNGVSVQLYDPSNNFAPFEGNQVPILNPVAKYLYAHPEIYPLPNHTPDAGAGPLAENFRGTSRTFNRYNQGDVRVDYTPGTRDRFMAHYGQAEGSDGYSEYPVPVFFHSLSVYPDKLFVVSNVHTFSSSLVNELRAGYSRIRWEQGNPIDTSGEFGLHGDQTVGICGLVAINPCTPQAFQGFAAQNVDGLNTPGNPAGGTNFIDNTFHYTEALTWLHGKHNSKAGVEFVRYQQNNFYPGNDGALGNFSYHGAFTSNPALGTTGYSVADFVLDRVAATAIGGVAGRTGQRQWRSAYYFQDDWRILPSLTLNLGARYEFDQPIYEVNDKTANVNFATGSVMYAGKIPTTNTVPNATVCPTRACYNANYNNLMPRVGLAYQVNPKTVVRAGYGITTYLEGTGANLRLTYNPPFQPSFEISATTPSATSPGVYFKVENGFSTAAEPNYSGTTYRAWDVNLKPAFINTFSMSVQREINNQSSLTLSYVGESGAHLIQAVAANQLRTPCLIDGVISNNPNSTACAASDPAPFQALVGQSGGVVLTASEGMYNYNALQVQYRQRSKAGLEYTVNYTYGRAMTNTDGFFGVPNISGPSPYAQNAYDNHAEYGRAGQDVRNSLNGTLVYKLPIGRGMRYGANMNRALDEAIGGWSFGFTGVAYSGFPVTIYSNDNNAYTNNRAIRPNQYFRVPIRNGKTYDHWFGTDPSIYNNSHNGLPVSCITPGTTTTTASGPTTACAFGVGPDGTYGTSAPGALTGPGYIDNDTSLSKSFAIFREHAISFRADAFNVFNHASFNNPESNIFAGNFGQIDTGVRSTERQLQLSAHYTF